MNAIIVLGGGMMSNKYRHLTRFDRMKIETYYNIGYSQSAIARLLDVNRSTICRELKRGMYDKLTSDLLLIQSYSSDKAQQIHDYNASAKGKFLKISNDFNLVKFIEDKITKDKYSPDAVTCEIKKKFKTTISTTTLYRYIDMGLFLNISNKDLPHSKKRKYKRVRIQKKSSAGTSIEKRPDVSGRKIVGDWEMDTIKGKRGTTKSCLLVLTERKTRYELVYKMQDQKSSSVVAALNKLELRLGDKFGKYFNSITVDNGVEFSDFQGMQQSDIFPGNKTKLYYCHAYSSWERGSNENNNRLIRRHIPKGVDFDSHTQEDILYIQNWINDYPRKLLKYKTSAQLYREELEKIGLSIDLLMF